MAICALSLSLFAADWYASPDGSDDDPGSLAQPWRALAKVNSLDLEPGSCVLLMAGGTFTGTLEIATADSGTPSEPLIVTTYGGEAMATMDSGAGRGIHIYNACCVEISNLVLAGVPAAARHSASHRRIPASSLVPKKMHRPSRAW